MEAECKVSVCRRKLRVFYIIVSNYLLLFWELLGLHLESHSVQNLIYDHHLRVSAGSLKHALETSAFHILSYITGSRAYKYSNYSVCDLKSLERLMLVTACISNFCSIWEFQHINVFVYTIEYWIDCVSLSDSTQHEPLVYSMNVQSVNPKIVSKCQ